MMNRVHSLIAKGDSLSLRERLIMFVLLMAAIWALVDITLTAPLDRARKQEAARLAQAQQRLETVQGLLAQQAAQIPPDVAAQQRLEAARANLEARLKEAGDLQKRMVAPKDMVRALQGLTGNLPGVRLISLDTLPPQAVVQIPATAQPGTKPDGTDEAAGGLYKHGVILSLTGSYEALVRYMAALERLPFGFYWERAELDADKHPEITLTLTLNTLSLERQWLRL